MFSGMNVCLFPCTGLRASMRVKVGMPAHVTGSATDAQPIHCQLVNISVSGVLLESTVPLPSEDELVNLPLAWPRGRGKTK
jgi:hypothetical protein